jgi:hypothetical protein
MSQNTCSFFLSVEVALLHVRFFIFYFNIFKKKWRLQWQPVVATKIVWQPPNGHQNHMVVPW